MKILLLLIILVLCDPSRATGPDIAQNFASHYNTWIELRQQAQPESINARELRAWQETKEAWKILQKTMDNYY